MISFLRTPIALALACFAQGAHADMLRFDLRATFLPRPWIGESIFGVDLSEQGTAYEFTGSFVLDTANPVGFVPAGGDFLGGSFTHDVHAFSRNSIRDVSISFGDKTWTAEDFLATDFPGPGGTIIGADLQLAGSATSPSALFFSLVDSDGTFRFGHILCLSSCFFENRADVLQDSPFVVASSLDVSWTVTPVPLPASLWLLMSGLGCVASLRRFPSWQS